MRGMSRIGTAGPGGRRSERGIALSIVALAMVAILGIAALVVDIGHGYRTRRALIPATDAAALAAAQTYVAGGAGCPDTASAYLAANESAATMTVCDPGTSTATRGRVTVTATDNVETWFAPVLGQGDYTVSSTSTVQWGPPSGATGLRPIGLCYNATSALRDLVDGTGAAYGGTPVTVTIPYVKSSPELCGSAVPGNWGFVDFSGTASNTNDQGEIVRNGYDGLVQFANDMTGPTKSCTGEPHCYLGDPGALAGLAQALTYLQGLDIWFTVPVYDYAEAAGSRARFHLMGVLRVKIVRFDVTGSQGGGGGGGSGGGSSGGGSGGGKPNNSGGGGGGGSGGGGGGGNNNSPYFELLVQPGLITGTCCGTTVGTGNNRVLAICAVDPSATGSCTA